MTQENKISPYKRTLLKSSAFLIVVILGFALSLAEIFSVRGVSDGFISFCFFVVTPTLLYVLFQKSTLHVRAINHAEKFFLKTILVGSVTPADAQDFRNWLRIQPGQQGKKLAEATIAKTCGVIHQGFLAAIDKGMISKSPFASKSISKSPGANPATQTLVSSQDIENVISQANDASDRIILGLARFGGLRMPSEAVGLKWEDIDWDKRVMRVQSPKTAHQNKASRLVPLFPKLYDLLKNEYANSKSEFLIPWLKPESNLNVRIRRQIQASGMQLYPKVLQTLRASCENDWISNSTYSPQKVALWSGHTTAVMFKHYIRVKDDSFTSEAAIDAAKVQSKDESNP